MTETPDNPSAHSAPQYLMLLRPAILETYTQMLPNLLAHCRPQPAIPALLLLMVTLLMALPASNQTQVSALIAWGVPIGLLGSAGLALAAGFCSFFPPLAWLSVAAMASGSLRSIAAPLVEPALWVGVAIAVAGLGIQAWRVATRRFVPTLDNNNEPT